MQYSLSDVASYIPVKINTEDISLDEYISTENMLPDKGGITRATSLPSTAKTNSFKEGDVLFSNIRTYFRKIWFATFKGGASNDVLVIRSLNGDILFNKYLYYLLSDEAFIQYTIATAKGTKMPRGDKSAIMNYQFELPSLLTQKKIAHILSTLDDKIELNRKMNETLEAMAQALFKSWFVDFDPIHVKATCKSEQELEVAASALGISKEILDLFPSEFEESEMGMIPLGWEVKAIKDFGQVITGKTPSTKIKENYGVKYPFITIPDMHNQTFIVNTARYLSEEGHCVQSNKLIPKNSLMVSCIATVGLVSISSEDSHTNQQINSIICSENNLYFLYCMLSSITDKLIMYGGAGTATLNVNKSIFENIRVIKPVDILLDKFLELVKPIFEKILANTKEIQTLQKTRDTLLPKLLSGELDVSNIDIGLENEV